MYILVLFWFYPAHIQITYVEPYFDSWELESRHTCYERNYNNSKRIIIRLERIFSLTASLSRTVHLLDPVHTGRTCARPTLRTVQTEDHPHHRARLSLREDEGAGGGSAPAGVVADRGGDRGRAEEERRTGRLHPPGACGSEDSADGAAGLRRHHRQPGPGRDCVRLSRRPARCTGQLPTAGAIAAEQTSSGVQRVLRQVGSSMS